MQVFAFDKDQTLCAKWQCDKHVVKIVLEATQILNTALYINDADDLAFYGKTHTNHPCCQWAAESFPNWLWLYHYIMALGDEYTYRYSGMHKSVKKTLRNIDLSDVIKVIPDGRFTQPPQAMPDDVKQDDTYEAYKDYYREYKYGEMEFKYTGRDMPEWL